MNVFDIDVSREPISRDRNDLPMEDYFASVELEDILRTFDNKKSFLEQDAEQAIIYLALLITASIVGTFGNVMIIGAHSCYGKLRKAGNTVTINLALADLSVTAIAEPMCILGVVLGEGYFDARPWLCKVVANACLSACLAAFLSLVLITMSQYLYVCHTEMYHKITGRKRFAGACILVWVIALAAELPGFIGQDNPYYDRRSHQCAWDLRAPTPYAGLVAISAILCPLLVMLATNAHIFFRVRASKQSVLQFSDRKASKTKLKQWAETVRSCRRMLLVVAAFVVCWLPYVIITVTDFDNRYPAWLHMWSAFLAHAHSILNFWIYLATSCDYRTGFALFLGIRSRYWPVKLNKDRVINQRAG